MESADGLAGAFLLEVDVGDTEGEEVEELPGELGTILTSDCVEQGVS